MYTPFSKLTPQRPPPENPKRIVLIRPCCIGDVVLATATLVALRRRFPDAHITWAVGEWSLPAIEHHPMLNAILDTGEGDLAVRSPRGMLRFVRQLRKGEFDLAVSLVRSPLMSIAMRLSGIPHRVGLDSHGRGFGYTLRIPVDPQAAKHEAEIYLETVQALGGDVRDCYAHIPVDEKARQAVQRRLAQRGNEKPFIVIHPAGGSNPGMKMVSKRWQPENFAALANRLSERFDAEIVLLAGPDDAAIVQEVRVHLKQKALVFVGELSFAEIGALAAEALLYIGNDTGLTHLAAASGGKTAMIFGPSDPKRYAPFTPHSIALWKPTSLNSGGVAQGTPADWDWARDGISVDSAYEQIVAFLQSAN